MLKHRNPPSQEPGTRTTDSTTTELSGTRPAPLEEPRPQERVQRHTVEQIIETFVPVQKLSLILCG